MADEGGEKGKRQQQERTQQRAALEALATTLDSMEEDLRLAAQEFRTATKTTREWMDTLEKESVKAIRGEANAAARTEPVIVMLASSSRWRRALISQILPEGFQLAEQPI